MTFRIIRNSIQIWFHLPPSRVKILSITSKRKTGWVHLFWPSSWFLIPINKCTQTVYLSFERPNISNKKVFSFHYYLPIFPKLRISVLYRVYKICILFVLKLKKNYLGIGGNGQNIMKKWNFSCPKFRVKLRLGQII